MSDSAMLIKEYRVVLPLTVDEYQAAQLWSVAEASKNETGGGEGIEIHKNEPYARGDERGQYTHKTYHLESRVSGFVRMIARKGMLQLEEEAWNAYPYCKTVLKNAYMKDAFEISIETIHLPDAGTTENAHKLAPETWKKVEVVNIDIAANDQVSAGDYKAELDPTRVRSARAGRGPLGPEWIAGLRKAHGGSPGKSANGDATPVMCCYKLVRVKFKWFGLQNRIEALIHRQEKRLFTNFHRQLFCWMDNWFGMTMDEIRELEAKTKKELQEMINQGELRGTRVNTDEA